MIWAYEWFSSMTTTTCAGAGIVNTRRGSSSFTRDRRLFLGPGRCFGMGRFPWKGGRQGARYSPRVRWDRGVEIQGNKAAAAASRSRAAKIAESIVFRKWYGP